MTFPVSGHPPCVRYHCPTVCSVPNHHPVSNHTDPNQTQSTRENVQICPLTAAASQVEARQVLKLTCSQMLKLEDQRLLQRIQESGLRHVWYSVSEGQRLLDLVTGGRDPEPSQDRDVMP